MRLDPGEQRSIGFNVPAGVSADDLARAKICVHFACGICGARHKGEVGLEGGPSLN